MGVIPFMEGVLPRKGDELLYLPTEMYQVDSPFSPQEVYRRLKDNTDPGRSSVLAPRVEGNWAFRGKIDGGHFELMRRIIYRTSFQPVLVGDIQSNGPGSRISIRFRLHWPVLAFWVIWMVAVGAVFVYRPNLLALIMLVAGYLMFFIPFNFEVNKAKAVLDEIMGGLRL